MSLPSFFVDKDNKIEDKIIINEDQNHHLRDVLCMREGDEVEVMLNDGYIHRCILCEVNKKQSVAEIVESRFVPKRASITLFMALIKSERLDWAVQKVTELGVDKIVPFESEYSVVKDKGNKVDRLNRIAVSAAKQCGRSILPEIDKTQKFDEMLLSLSQYSQIVVAYEGEKQNAREVLAHLDVTKPIALIIGSEGGFSQNEIDKLTRTGAKVISLGQNILRAETACVALLSAVNYELGLWEKNE